MVEITELILWFFGLGLALVMVAALVLAAVGRVSARVLLGVGYASILLYCLVGAAALKWSGSYGGQFVVALRVGILLATTGACIAHLVFLHYVAGQGLFTMSSRPKLKRGYVISGLALVYVVIGIIAAGQYFHLLRGKPSDNLLAGFHPQFEPAKDFYLRTDRGRSLIALRTLLPAGTQESVADAPARLLDGYLIREGPVDTRCNCHGWLFAGGECVLMGDAVEVILEDNGYHEVSDPQPGDIIIYRDERGVIMHSGLVRGLLDDGTPLIESKWALGARYLHRPMDQIFSPHFSYYRTTRKSDVSDLRVRHLVEIVVSSMQEIPAREINSSRSPAGGDLQPQSAAK